MAMRRGHHTSRVLKALGTGTAAGSAVTEEGPDLLDLDPDALPPDEALPNQFDDHDA